MHAELPGRRRCQPERHRQLAVMPAWRSTRCPYRDHEGHVVQVPSIERLRLLVTDRQAELAVAAPAAVSQHLAKLRIRCTETS